MTVTAATPQTLTIDEAIDRLNAVAELAPATLSQRYPDRHDRDAALRAMTRDERVGLFWANGMSLDDACRWAAMFRSEVPLIDGEFAFHMVNSPEIADRREARP